MNGKRKEKEQGHVTQSVHLILKGKVGRALGINPGSCLCFCFCFALLGCMGMGEEEGVLYTLETC